MQMTVLFTANRSFERSVRKLHGDLHVVSDWCNENGIMANTENLK